MFRSLEDQKSLLIIVELNLKVPWMQSLAVRLEYSV